MSNMSYCKYRNTANDLEDVVDTWEDAEFSVEELSEDEKIGREKIIKLARQIVEIEWSGGII